MFRPPPKAALMSSLTAERISASAGITNPLGPKVGTGTAMSSSEVRGQRVAGLVGDLDLARDLAADDRGDERVRGGDPGDRLRRVDELLPHVVERRRAAED